MFRNLLHNRIVKYIFFGGLTTLVNVSSYSLIRLIFKIDINMSNFISIALSILFAYVVNSKYVFESECNNYREKVVEFNKFVGARISTMLIEILGVYIMTFIIHINEFISKLFIQFIVLILNYVFSKLIVFKHRTGSE